MGCATLPVFPCKRVCFGQYEGTCSYVLPVFQARYMLTANTICVTLPMQCAWTVNQDVCKWLHLVFIMHVASVIRSGHWPQADYTISGKHSWTVDNYKGSGCCCLEQESVALFKSYRIHFAMWWLCRRPILHMLTRTAG